MHYDILGNVEERDDFIILLVSIVRKLDSGGILLNFTRHGILPHVVTGDVFKEDYVRNLHLEVKW